MGLGYFGFLLIQSVQHFNIRILARRIFCTFLQRPSPNGNRRVTDGYCVSRGVLPG